MRQKGALILLALLLLFLPRMSSIARTGEQLLAPPREERGFQGILEVWLCETFVPGKGSFLGWVDKAVKAYERAHPGVYVRVRVMQEPVVRARLDAGDTLPDAILCGGGVVTAQDTLLPCAQRAVPRFSDAVTLDGTCLAYPAAAGGYTALYQQAALDKARLSAPQAGDLASLQAASGTPALLCGWDPWLCPAAAFEAWMPGADPACLHPRFARRTLRDAWADFVLDRASVGYVCTQKEVYRIDQLLAGGSAFEWTFERSGCPYTDQLLALYLPDTGASPARMAATQAFGALLQSDEMQDLLADYGAFSVTGRALYPPESCMGVMEGALSGPECCVPNQLTWRERAQAQALALSQAQDTEAALKAARQVLRDTKSAESAPAS